VTEIQNLYKENDWKTAKVLCSTEEEMMAVVREWTTMEIDT
jgi:hypothetical protein